MKPDLSIMKLITDEAERHQTPFGAAISLGDQVFTTAVHQTSELNEPAEHAVMQVLQNVSDLTGKAELSGFTLYSTCEPCSECLRAANHKNVNALFFGCSGESLHGYFEQVHFLRPDEKELSSITIQGGIMEEKCKSLLEQYS